MWDNITERGFFRKKTPLYLKWVQSVNTNNCTMILYTLQSFAFLNGLHVYTAACTIQVACLRFIYHKTLKATFSDDVYN